MKRRPVPERLFDRGRDERGLRDQLGGLVWMLDEREGAQRNEVPGGFITGDEQKEGEVE